jgi:hypothetical protein
MNIACTPGETDTPLVIDSNTICSSPIALQEFKLISGRHAKILQPQSPVQIQQFPPRGPFDGLKSRNSVILKERFGV